MLCDISFLSEPLIKSAAKLPEIKSVSLGESTKCARKFTFFTYVERFFAKRCAEILMHKGLRKPPRKYIYTNQPTPAITGSANKLIVLVKYLKVRPPLRGSDPFLTLSYFLYNGIGRVHSSLTHQIVFLMILKDESVLCGQHRKKVFLSTLISRIYLSSCPL